jgi:translation initiation factor IF-3
VPEVLVIAANGEKLGVMPTDQAVALAEDIGLDLVEVSPKARPPVCRIMDYGKYKYQQRKKTSEAKKNAVSSLLKEVKFRPKTDVHDFNFKVDHIRRFLSEGHKVKVTIRFRGREVMHADRGTAVCKKIEKFVNEHALGTVEQMPRMEGKDMHMIIAPKPGARRQIKRPEHSVKGKAKAAAPIAGASAAAGAGAANGGAVDPVAAANEAVDAAVRDEASDS